MALARICRWVGRVTSVIVLAFIVLSATVPAGPPSSVEVVGLVFFPGIVGVGFLLAWWREGLGALVATLGLVGFYVCSLASGAHFARGPWFLVCWSPTLFFAGSWLLRRPHSS
ncbi:MAG TPA: hypothetical protein VNH63_08735 [Gemmatimonadales bacterium]|nr:hypothetical protein [Gemmatimonadales bacterium]